MLLGALVLATVVLPAGEAAAQTPDQQANTLLQQAQQAYTQFLDIGSAQASVDQAITIVQQYGVTGATAALAYALRGVIHLWMGEEAQAIEMFRAALMNNPGVQIPPDWGGPDVDAAMQRARSQVAYVAPPPTCPVGTVMQPNGTCAAPMPTCPAGTVLQPNGTCAAPMPTCPPGTILQPNGTCAAPMPTCPPGTILQPNGTCAAPMPTCPPGTVLQPNGVCAAPMPAVPMTRHTPVLEQLWNHPVPIYIELNPSLTVGGVFLFYRSPSDTGYQRMEMGRTGPGYYVEIPCTILQPGGWDYYIMVLDPSGNPLATEGSADRPFHVNMVQTITGLFPTRPDGSTLPDCGPDGSGRGIDCPPGLPCGGVACERSCTFNDDCLGSEICMAGCCKEKVEEPGPTGPGGPIGLFIQLAAGLGVGIVRDTAIGRTGRERDTCESGQWDPPCARVKGGAMISPFQLRLGFGYFFVPEFAASVHFRAQPVFGDFFPYVFDARLAYYPLSETHKLGLFVGGGYGWVSHRLADVEFTIKNPDFCDPGEEPPDDCTAGEPETVQTKQTVYKLSGMGEIAFGASYSYQIASWFALGADLAMGVYVPEFVFNIDLSLLASLTF
jgi:hypothetical protein